MSMDLWIVLPGIAGLALVFVAAPVATAAYVHWRRPFRLTCPLTASIAQINVSPLGAARAAVLGASAGPITRCSLWGTTPGCRAECLALPAAALRPVRRGEPPPPPDARAGIRTILVPLDGAPESERVLDAVAALARAQHRTVRLVHVAGSVEAIRGMDGQILAFADQVTASIEHQQAAYFARLRARLPGVRVEGTVRFGDPVTEIVEEAEAVGADVIAFAAPAKHRMARWLRRTIPHRVARTTTIALLMIPARAA